jgi:cysteine-rich repeat protein
MSLLLHRYTPVTMILLAACSSGGADDGATLGTFTTFSTLSDGTSGDGDGDTGDGDPGDGDGDAGDGDGEPSGTCGDGILDVGEECDLGEQNSDNSNCTTTCHIAICGDGLVLAGLEDCDDGNASNTDECVQDCKAASCGDGYVQDGVEMCDDGNDDETDGCNVMCLPGTCGDGIVQMGEQCDDGNGDTFDDCPACQLSFCGDGFIKVGIEICDDGNLETDDGCISPLCVPAECGDGFVQAGVEECDDQNQDNGDACPSCMNAVCGDGFKQLGVEECDDGDMDNEDNCSNDCISLGLTIGVEAPLNSCVMEANDIVDKAVQVLIARGHEVVEIDAAAIDTLEELSQFNVIVPTSAGANCYQVDWSQFDGIIDDWVNQGGGIVLTGWGLWGVALDSAPNMRALMPFNDGDVFLSGNSVGAVGNHPISQGLANFTAQHSNYGGQAKNGATVFAETNGTDMGAAWTVGQGRVVYLAPIYMEDYNSYQNENLLDGSQPSALEMFNRAVEWAGGTL